MILIIAGSKIVSGAEYVLKDYLECSSLKSQMIVLTSDSEELKCFFSTIGLNKTYFSRLFGQTGAISTGSAMAWLKKGINYLKSKSPIRGIITTNRIVKVVGNNAGDIIYAMFIKKINKNIQFLLFVHEMIDKKTSLGTVLKIFDRNVDKYIAVSEAVKGKLIEIGIEKKKIIVVYNGLYYKNKIIKKYNEREINVGYIGNLEKNKSPLSFIEFIKVLSQSSNIAYNSFMAFKHLDHSIFKEIKKEIDKNNLKLDLIGSVDRNQIDSFYEKIDFLFVPFINNSLPTVILEAFNNGIPVIGRRSGGVPEMIKHGENGFLYDSDSDLNKMINCIRSLRVSGYESLSRNANNTIKNKFNIFSKRDLLDSLLSS